MSPSRSKPAAQIGPDDPNDPPPEQDPTHDVPVYPEGDPPPTPETPIRAAAGPGEHDLPDEGGVTRASHGQPREGMPRSDGEQANACAKGAGRAQGAPRAHQGGASGRRLSRFGVRVGNPSRRAILRSL